MDLGPPRGVRDYPPEPAARLLAAAGALLEVFERYGYRRVVVPTLERAELLRRGLGESERRLYHTVDPESGEVVAVAPDPTAQVARIFARVVAGAAHPLRVSYAGPVLRPHEDRPGRPKEIFQTGVECLGGAGPLHDLEIVLLCLDGLEAVGVADPTLDIGHAGFLEAVLGAAELSSTVRAEVEAALGRKDAGAIETLLRQAGGATPKGRRVRRLLPELCDLWGHGSLAAARRIARRARAGEACVDEVEALIERLSQLEVRAQITTDLGENRGYGYYTGLTVHAFAEGVGAEVARGGRYDGLLARYGAPAPAVGLAVDLTDLLTALEPDAASPGGILLLRGRARLDRVLAEARRLRRAGQRVVVHDGALAPAAAWSLARSLGVGQVLRFSRGALRPLAPGGG